MFAIFKQSAGWNVWRRIAVVLSAAASFSLPAAAFEAWPDKVRDLPETTPIQLTWAGFHVGVRSVAERAPRDETDAPEYRFTIRNISTGAITTFLAPSARGAVLERFGGSLQFELWTRGAAGSWSRHLYRFVRGQYRSVRIDDFTETASDSRDETVTAAVPGLDDPVYFVQTRTP